MKKHALRLLAALLAAAAVAGLAAAPIIYFKISDKLLLNRELQWMNCLKLQSGAVRLNS